MRRLRCPFLMYENSTRRARGRSLLAYPKAEPVANTTRHNLQVNEAVLRKVIEWCEHHRNDPPSTSEEESDSRKKTTDIEEWDQKFMQVDQEMLFEIILVRSLALGLHNNTPLGSYDALG